MKLTSENRGKKMTVGGLMVMVAAMIALVAASVPLYRLFCAATGYNGTTQRAERAPDEIVASRTITVRFDATTSPELPWTFEPVQRSVQVHPGEPVTIAYRAKNNGSAGVTGKATFNVTPDKTGLYFDKVQCFCFTAQYLAPGEEKEMPVIFFIDPDIVKDANARDVDTITLSYTMFRDKDQDDAAKTAASSGPATTFR